MNKAEKLTGIVKKRFKEKINGLKKTVSDTIRRFIGGITDSAAVKYLLKKETVEYIVKSCKCIGLCIAAFFFGACRIEYMAYPLGFAFLIASGKLSFFVYAGSAVAALTYPELGFAFFGVNTLIYIIRKILLSDSFCESRRARVILAFFTAFFISLSLILSVSSGTFSDVDVAASPILCCICYIIGIPLAVVLFYPVTSGESFTGSSARLSLCFFCICLIMSSTFPGIIALPYFTASICTLFFCTFFDGFAGVPAGALFGIATLNFTFGAPLCISAFLFIKFCQKKQLTVYPMYFICAFILSVITSGEKNIQSIFISLLLSTVLYMPAGLIICSQKSSAEISEGTARDTVREAYTNRMSALSGAFGAVSKLCFSFSNRTRFPTEDEVQVLVSVHCAKACGACREYYGCTKKQFWCDRAVASRLMSGKLTAVMLPPRLSAGCPSSQNIVKGLNAEYTKLLSDRFNNNKTEILAQEYATMGRILKYTAKVSSSDAYFDGKLTSLACTATRKLGLTNTGVSVYGVRKKTLDICGVPVSEISMPSEDLAAFYSSECLSLFDTPEFILDEDNTFTVRFRSGELISAEYVNAVHTKCGETVCGDSVSFFKSDDSYFYALIADGMGSGRDAAMTSRLTAVFIEKLLSGGAGKGVTIELLNNLLMTGNKECFSGVDLLEVDLINKKASFVKAGAAPAYLMRSAKLFKVSSNTPPCGIIEGFCAENTSFDIVSGDIIIMLSDGITSSIDCGTALCDIMNQAKGQPLDTVAGRILDMAVSMSVHDDDMTCIIVRIK